MDYNRVINARCLGQQPYDDVYQCMQRFTARRSKTTTDELWLLQHPPVYTLGRNGKLEHLRSPGQIPVQQVDRGGQVTYHGPGQVVMYALLDLTRRGKGVRQLVNALENAVIRLLHEYDILAEARHDAPGVYVQGRKLAALGLRVRHGCSYHGLSLNVAMDLEPFSRINPCGYADMAVTQLQDLGIDMPVAKVAKTIATLFAQQFGYDELMWEDDTVEHLRAAGGQA
jgi:lipoyl(octanoyl) transferase